MAGVDRGARLACEPQIHSTVLGQVSGAVSAEGPSGPAGALAAA
jgi:hypothetical protein